MKIRLVNNGQTAIQVGAVDGTKEVIAAMGGAHNFEPDTQTKADLEILMLTGQYQIVDFAEHLQSKIDTAEAAVDVAKRNLADAEDHLDGVIEELRLHNEELEERAAAAKKTEEDAAADEAAKKNKKA